MSKIKVVIIIVVGVLLGAGMILAGFWFLPGKLFSVWTNKIIASNQQNIVEVNDVKPVDCSLPVSKDMALLEKHEAVEQTSLRCAAFQEEKLQYDFDPKNALTWDNAFPSRENWARKRDLFRKVLSEKWSTYRSEKYKFEFEYPQGWNILVATDGSQIVLSNPGTQVISPMVINISEYAIASDGPGEWEQNSNNIILLTKVGLAEKKKQIEDSVPTSDKYGKFVILSNDYSTAVYHNFYRHGEFFIDNNLISVVQPLSVVVSDVAGWVGVQSRALDKINAGSFNELVKLEVKFIDRVVDSFRPVSLKSIK